MWGGLIFMKGTPVEQVRLTNTLQSLAKFPLLIGIDAEWGLAMRLEHTFKFPWNMALGAIAERSLLESMGRRLALHCRRMGVHINFTPVVDSSTNPRNPIIGNRSFGQDPQNVFEKSWALVKGLQSENVMACAKHFPGHGDTQSDSHNTLPRLNFSFKRLKNVELYPYRKLFQKGIKSVMVAHLNVPVLEKNRKKPTSLSYNVVTNFLQKQMGFQGLIFTDGLTMKGVTDYAKNGQAALQAFLAGNDILLIPKKPKLAFKALKKAFNKKQFTMQRLEHSVKKILRAKYWAGLHKPHQKIPLKNLIEDLNTPQDKALKQKLVAASMTLIKNQNKIFPIYQLQNKKFAYLNLGTDSGAAFLETLRKYTRIKPIKKTTLPEILEQLRGVDCVFIGYHISDKTPWKSYSFSKNDSHLLAQIARKHKVILSVFASPYSLLRIPTQHIESILVAYQNSEVAQSIAAQAIFWRPIYQGQIARGHWQKISCGYGEYPACPGEIVVWGTVFGGGSFR